MNRPKHDNAGIPFPPPLCFTGLVVGITVNIFFPMRFLDLALTAYVGLPLIVVGFAIAALTLRTMLRAGTSPDPDASTRVLLTAGPFAFTRNPIYVSFAVVHLGFAITLNSLLALSFLPLAVFAIDRLVIVREENYLERKFGDDYLHYKTRVCRWL